MKLLIRAESLIQRDALINALREQGIEAVTGERDISRKYADETVDLAYGGISAVFEGFSIWVPEAELSRAQGIVAEVMESVRSASSAEPLPPESHMRRFFFCTLMSIVFPVVMNILALGHLIRGLRAGESIKWWMLVFGILIWITTSIAGYFLLRSFLLEMNFDLLR